MRYLKAVLTKWLKPTNNEVTDMTQTEYESQKYTYMAAIDETFTSLKSQANALKHVEDKEKNLTVLLKIGDLMQDIRNLYSDLENFEYQAYEEMNNESENENSEYGTGSSFLEF